MEQRPVICRKHRICVICEGYEDYAYFTRLTELSVWNSVYHFNLINAKSASNIPARFQDAYQNDRDEIILIFCDTDKAPYKEYANVKRKINEFLNKRKASEKIIIYANPCTMQIILLHFGEVLLKNQGKKTNSGEIEKWTGVKNYDAHEDQIQEICRKIFQSSYQDMRNRVAMIYKPDDESGSSNFIVFLQRFENEDNEWIEKINRYLQEK